MTKSHECGCPIWTRKGILGDFKYDDQYGVQGCYKEMYAICDQLYGGSYINLCCGSKNFGQVITQKTN